MIPDPEKNRTSVQPLETPQSPESTANFEGNYSLLLFKRMRNPFILEQLVNLLYEEELDHEIRGDNVVAFDEDGNILLTEDGDVLTQKKAYHAKSKKEIIDALYKRLADTENDTPITYNEDVTPGVHNGREIMPIFSDSYIPKITHNTLPKNVTRIKSITEAHEKGHVIHDIAVRSSFFDKRFRKGFDVNRGSDALKEEIARNPNQEKRFTDENIQEMFVNYLFSASEIVERMSQLKGYYGFKGNETFTKEHLEYARSNYCKDTEVDNHMTAFFDAITPETEDEFLRLINTSGV